MMKGDHSFQVELTELEFQRQVLELAERLQWKWMHVPRSQTRRGWRVQIMGPLGRGWPDLVLVKGRRLLFVELKGERGILSEDQQANYLLLSRTDAECYVWRPSDWPSILDTLARDMEGVA